MKFYVVEPEVAGGWGDNIKVDRSGNVPKVEHLHYQFEGWSGDELLTTHPCFICTERVAQTFTEKRLSGFQLAEMEVSTSEQFEELYPNKKLPKFYWLQITGAFEENDFGIRENKLVVSEKALECLKSFTLSQAEVFEVSQYEWNSEKRTEQMFERMRAELKRRKAP